MTVKELIETYRQNDLYIEVRENNFNLFSTHKDAHNNYIECIYDRKVNNWFTKSNFCGEVLIVIDLEPLESED